MTTEPKSTPAEKAAAVDAEISRLAETVMLCESMAPEERYRTFKYLASRYSKEWPTSDY